MRGPSSSGAEGMWMCGGEGGCEVLGGGDVVVEGRTHAPVTTGCWEAAVGVGDG